MNLEEIKNKFLLHNYLVGEIDVVFINTTWNKIKQLEDPAVLLPTSKNPGWAGTYHEDWMIHHHQEGSWAGLYSGEIWDWYGDKSTTRIIEVTGSTKLEVYQKLLLRYALYLRYSSDYEGARICLNELLLKINTNIIL